jgi:hypothetical protein
MARDYEGELIEIEKRRQANNEATRTEGRTERNRLEDAIKQNPEYENLYKDEIASSQKREEDFVASNDKVAAAQAADVEAAQKAAAQAAVDAPPELVPPPPPAPANDNRQTAYSNLAAQEAEPPYPRKFDNYQDYQSALKDLSETALESSKEYNKASSALNDAKSAESPDIDRIAELQADVDRLDEKRTADASAVAELKWANLEYDGAAEKPPSISDHLPSKETVIEGVQNTMAVGAIIAGTLNPLSLADKVDIQDAVNKGSETAIEYVQNLPKEGLSSTQDVEESRHQDLEDKFDAIDDIREIEKEADIEMGVEGARVFNDAMDNATVRAIDPPAAPGGGGSAGPAPSTPAPEAPPAVARVEMRQPSEVKATASNVELELMPAPPPPPPPPPTPANQNTLQT